MGKHVAQNSLLTLRGYESSFISSKQMHERSSSSKRALFSHFPLGSEIRPKNFGKETLLGTGGVYSEDVGLA